MLSPLRPTTPGSAHIEQVAPCLVALAVVISVGNLVGWAGDIRFLISVSPGLPSMVPITALLALITSLGLWQLHRSPAFSWKVALAPIALILATLLIEFCYLRGAAPPPFILAKSGVETPFTLASPLTSGLFFLLACASLSLTRKSLVIAAQCLALLVFFVALLNLSGYLLQETFLFRVLPNRGTSILTTATVMSLAAAILFTHPHSGLMAAITGDLPGARISRRLLLAAFLVPIFSGIAVSVGMQIVFYDVETMLIIFVWIVILLFLTIVWRLAMRLAASDQERASAQRALQQAVSDLQQEHQSKDMFMATLAHELRNPLAPISAAAELLKRGGGKTEADRQRLGETIAAQSTSLVNLVDDLMDMERLNTGRLSLDKQPIDVRKVIGRAVEQIAPMLSKRRHQYLIDLPVVPLCVCGDYSRLTQVFANLLSNAAKYTPPGGEIKVRSVTSGTSAHIIVTDNGNGMNDELLAHLFEPYVQAQITPDRADGGLGLGLALVKKLTELHGGTVTASSDGIGAGSSFTVTLPLFEIRPPAGDALQQGAA